MRESHDHSLFAWTPPEPDMLAENPLTRGILATHPSNFRFGANLMPYQFKEAGELYYSMTNRGLRISIPILESAGGTMAILSCALNRSTPKILGIHLKRLDSDGNEDIYARDLDWNVYQISPEEVKLAKVKTIYLVKRDYYEPPPAPEDETEMSLEDLISHAVHDIRIYPLLKSISPMGERMKDSHMEEDHLQSEEK